MTVPAPPVVLGVDPPEALRGLARRLVDDPPGDVVVRRPAAVVADPALQDVATRPGTVTLTAAGAPTPVATGFGQILAVDGSTGTSGTGAVGWLRIAAADRRTAAGILRRAADQLSDASVRAGDAFTWVLRALVRGGVVVRAVDIDPYPWSVGGPPPPQPDRDEVERIRLLRANRAGDSGYSIAVLRRLSKPLTSLAVRRGWAPNSITVMSLVIGLLAAAAFAQGSRAALLVGAVLLQVSLVVDCSDGEVARMTGRFSRTGAWLDAVTDRIKEFAAYIGLAIGSGVAALWWVAGALIVLQTVRHLSDYTFEEVQRGWAAADARGPLLPVDENAGGVRGTVPTDVGGGAATLRRALFLPIGERWLILSLAAVILGAGPALWLMFGLGLLSLAYASLGRAVRTRRWTGGPVATGLIVRQLDTAPFGLRLPLGGHSGALLLTSSLLALVAVVALVAILPVPAGALLLLAATAVSGVRAALFRPAWAAPAALAALEMVPWVVGGVMLAPDAGPAVVAVVFGVSFHRYDLLYRAMAGDSVPPWLAAAALGVPVRMIVLGVALLFEGAPGGVALPFAVYLGLVVVVMASVQWLASGRSTRSRGGLSA